jgi:hypothetical protein
MTGGSQASLARVFDLAACESSFSTPLISRQQAFSSRFVIDRTLHDVGAPPGQRELTRNNKQAQLTPPPGTGVSARPGRARSCGVAPEAGSG